MNASRKRGGSALSALLQPYTQFPPIGTVRCSSSPYFRSQLTRDLGCLLDVDDDIVAWCCTPYGMENALRDIGWKGPPPDFLATYSDGRDVYLHAVEGEGDPEVTEAAACRQMWHRYVTLADIRAGARLQNAKDLLRYAYCSVPLGDRIRLLAALEQDGSVTVAESLTAFREVEPMAGLSALILNRFVAVDLDVEPIAPHTIVRTVRR